jgi:predicted 3-demethylubiquinone-9 3-methyltransferase (glyoxalase superfamily)
MGIPCIGLNGGPEFKQNEAFSFQVATAANWKMEEGCQEGWRMMQPLSG